MAFMRNTRRDRSVVINVLSTIAAIIYISTDYGRRHRAIISGQLDAENTREGSWAGSEASDQERLILLWGDWRDKRPDSVDNCQFKCKMTDDASRVGEAAVVVFDGDVESNWPGIRFENQTYVHLLSERPGPSQSWLYEYDDKINLTWNYRHDADISIHSIIHVNTAPSVDDYVPQFPLSNKSMSVVWVVSNCNASSKRGRYMKELAKYIDVHLYGGCGLRSCPKENDSTCLDLFQSNYKFYVGFESRICKDYITDQFYKPLRYELIPIVLGGADYNMIGPPNSFINARDFESPKVLAQYLHHLEHSDEDYYSYFTWKSRYTITTNEREESCMLCNVAHNSSLSRPAHKDYYNWWFSVCDDRVIDNMQSRGNWS